MGVARAHRGGTPKVVRCDGDKASGGFMFSLGAPQSELTPSLNDAGFVHSGSMGAWHALRWSSRGDKLVLELVLWPITMQAPHSSEREGRDTRGLSGARATKFNSSNIATWRVYDSVKHGS